MDKTEGKGPDTIDELRERLEEAEETLRAIRAGEVDAVVVSGPHGDQVYALKGAEQPYRVMVESMNEGAVILTDDGTIFYSNHSFASMLDVPLEQVVGSTLDIFLVPEDLQSYRVLVRQAREGKSKGEVRLKTKQGSVLPVDLSLSTLEASPSGNLCAVVTDLSQHKRNQELMVAREHDRATRLAAETARERITGILESITDPFFAVNGEWRITYINQGALSIFGKPKEELIGTILWDLSVSEIEEVYKQYQKAMTERVAVHFEGPVVIAGALLEDRWFERHVHPMEDGLAVYLRDITGRRQAEARTAYQAYLLANVHDVILATDDQFRLTAWNTRAEEIFGWKAEEVIGRQVGEVIRSEFTDTQRSEALKSLAETGHFHAEVAQYSRDGSRLWMQGHTTVLRDESGRITGYVGVNRDITEAKRDESLLRKANETIEMILSSITDRFFALDHEWRFTYMNKNAEEQVKILGKNPASLIGKVSWEEFQTDPDVQEAFHLAKSQQRVITHENYYAPLGEWVENRIYPTSDGGVAVFQQYVTERKQAEEALRRSEAYLAEGQRISHTGSWAWNLYTGELFWSPEHFRICGVDSVACKITMEKSRELIHPDDRISAYQMFDKAVQEGTDFDWHFRFVRPDGAVRYVHSLGHPVFDDTGKLKEYIGTVADVTDRTMAEEALREARAKLAQVSRLTTMGELAASLAHELNQSLAAIVTNGDACLRWLGRSKPDLREATDGIQRMIGDAKRAGEVIAHTRALLKKSVGEKTAVDTTEIIRDVLTLVRAEMERQRIVVHDQLAENLPAIVGVRAQLQQVVLNLIMNAAEAMAEVSERSRDLVIRSGRHEFENGPRVIVTVQDAGIGIPAESLDRIFEAYYTTKIQGLGLGLSISRSIIEAHGGRLWASRNSDYGMTFQFIFPCGSTGEL